MYIKNRLIALIYRLTAFIIGSIAMLYDFGLFNGQFKRANLLYFTIISNLFCIVFFGVLTIKTFYDIRRKGLYGFTTFSSYLRGEILISILLTMSVYHFILIPYAVKINPYQSLKINDIIFHYVMPIFTLFDWILFDEKGSFKWYDPLYWVIGPYLYLIYIFMQAGLENIDRINANMNKYVYVFLDVDLIGVTQVAINIISLTIIFIIIGYFIYWFDRIKILDEEDLKIE